jgi:3-oxoacyl-(acyl-carrier-protein) synthase
MNSPALAHLLRDNPIVVTGMGCVSAAGNSVGALWQAALAGRSLAAWREFPAAHGDPLCFAVCSVPDIDVSSSQFSPARKADRCAQLAMLAANQAWEEAGLSGAYPPERIGVMVGSSRGPLGKIQESFECLGHGALPPTLSAQSSMGSLSGVLAQQLDLKGPGAVISATCASAAFAIAFAAEQILLGKTDAMLVGGAEAPLCPAILAQLKSSGVLGSHAEATQTCRPFDVTRNGIVLGEGSAFLIIESAHLAARRRVKPLANLTGWSMNVDSLGRTGVQEDGSSIMQAMEQALDIAQLSASQIGYVNAHGSGTVMSDLAEAKALGRIADNGGIPCSSTKPMTGHCLGATPALEAVLCVNALRHQKLPPRINCAEPDPRCPIRLTGAESQSASLKSAMSNSLGFWGYHASLIFSAAPAS